MKGGLLLNVVVAESAAIFKLLAGEDQALLVRGDTVRETKDFRINSRSKLQT